MDFTELSSCGEIDATHADAAVASRDAMRKLLARVAQIAKPEEGCPKILLVLGRLARGNVSWIDGAICAELTDDEGTTLLSILSDVGFGLFEPMFPAVRLDAPLDEFVRAAKLAPKMFEPLVVEESAGKLLLAMPEKVDPTAGAFDLDDPAELAAPSPSPAPAIPLPRPPTPMTPLVSPVSPVSPVQPGPQADPAVHTRPTVRRMVAIDPSLFAKRPDPRRDDDD